MNEVLNNIITRRSIRSYTPEQITDEQLGLILETAKYAPSGGNNQTWLFTVVQNSGVLESLNSLVRASLERLGVDENTYISKVRSKNAAKNPGYSFYYNAPTLIIASNLREYSNAFADCAAAIENMLLAAHSLSLGACWINQLTWFGEEPDIRKSLHELGIPDGHIVCGAAAVGYAAVREPKATARRENTVKIIR